MPSVRIPQASIGGYRAILKPLTDDNVMEAWRQQGEIADRLSRELAAAIERRDTAWRELQDRLFPPQKQMTMTDQEDR